MDSREDALPGRLKTAGHTHPDRYTKHNKETEKVEEKLPLVSSHAHNSLTRDQSKPQKSKIDKR